MPVVFACIAPHGGHLLLEPSLPCPVPKTREAMGIMQKAFTKSNPETVVILTPHGVYAESLVTLGITPKAYGELDNLIIEADVDLDFAASWAYHATDMNVPIGSVSTSDGVNFPLDWGVTIPLVLLDPNVSRPIVVSCPARDIAREQLVAWGEAIVLAAEELNRRVAVIISADQGHGHAHDGPYGFTAGSAEYDQAMIDVIQSNSLDRLLKWDDNWIEAGMPDSYWQTLCLYGIQKRVPLKSTFLSYEIDHYFGLLCAMYEPQAAIVT